MPANPCSEGYRGRGLQASSLAGKSKSRERDLASKEYREEHTRGLPWVWVHPPRKAHTKTLWGEREGRRRRRGKEYIE